MELPRLSHRGDASRNSEDVSRRAVSKNGTRQHIRAGEPFQIGDIEINPFAIPHDAADPVGYSFRSNGVKVAIVTDLGYMPELVKHHLREADFLILESNHDLEMLKVGPYPWFIKQRVMSRTGHLSNTRSANFSPMPNHSTAARATWSSRISPSRTIIPTSRASPPKKP